MSCVGVMITAIIKCVEVFFARFWLVLVRTRMKFSLDDIGSPSTHVTCMRMRCFPSKINIEYDMQVMFID